MDEGRGERKLDKGRKEEGKMGSTFSVTFSFRHHPSQGKGEKLKSTTFPVFSPTEREERVDERNGEGRKVKVI